MRTLVISFLIWVLIVPALVALFLIFTFVAAFVPDLYFASTSFALAFALVTMVWGSFWSFSASSGRLFPRNREHPNSTQEKKRAHSFQVRS